MQKYLLIALLYLLGNGLAAQKEANFGIRVGALITHQYNAWTSSGALVFRQNMSPVVQPLLHGFYRKKWGERFSFQLETGYAGNGFQVKDPQERGPASRVVAHQLQTGIFLMYNFINTPEKAYYLLTGLTHNYVVKLTARQNPYLPPVEVAYDKGSRHLPWAEVGIGGLLIPRFNLGWELRYAHSIFQNPVFFTNFQCSLSYSF